MSKAAKIVLAFIKTEGTHAATASFATCTAAAAAPGGYLVQQAQHPSVVAAAASAA
jgi:hypothetical protein